ncbi:MAG: hypothetical protein H6621_08815 [Halobacteriovoraceae bacterium]|nr:hypothetical protein [Halobacteriovoraceae bacterium]
MTGCLFDESPRGNRGTATSGGSSLSQGIKPESEVKMLPNYCACNEGKPIILGNCLNFCADKVDSQDTLYIETILGKSISLNPQLGSLYNWCFKEVISEDGVSSGANPSCVIEAMDSNGSTTSLDVIINPGDNKFTVNLQSLTYDQAYILTLIEQSSQARSNSIQIKKVKNFPTEPAIGPLGISPVHRYDCHRNYNQTAAGGEAFYRLTYFYTVNDPTPLPPGTDTLAFHCHDTQLYGPVDGPLFPRLELSYNSFAVWNPTDPRFFDNDANQRYDIHDILQGRLDATGNSNITVPTIFQPINWPNAPLLNNDGSVQEQDAEGAPTMGFIMRAWMDENYKGYCPNNSHYTSQDPLFRELGDILGVETEALYFAERMAFSIFNLDGTQGVSEPNYLLVKESLIKKIWFYIDGFDAAGNPQYKTPTDENIRGKTVYFYWPANTVTPTVQSDYQKLYRVKHTTDISDSSSTLNGPIPSTPPHDKRIGCVPK